MHSPLSVRAPSLLRPAGQVTRQRARSPFRRGNPYAFSDALDPAAFLARNGLSCEAWAPLTEAYRAILVRRDYEQHPVRETPPGVARFGQRDVDAGVAKVDRYCVAPYRTAKAAKTAAAPAGHALAIARAAYEAAPPRSTRPAGQADDSGSPAIDAATMDAILAGAPDMTFTPAQVGQAQGPSSGFDAQGNVVQTPAQQRTQQQALSAIGAALGQAGATIAQIIASNDQVALARLNADITTRIGQLQAEQAIATQQGRAADAQRAADAANALLNSQRALLAQPAAVPWGWVALGVALLGALAAAAYATFARGRGARRSGTRARMNPTRYGFGARHGCGCMHGRRRAA